MFYYLPIIEIDLAFGSANILPHLKAMIFHFRGKLVNEVEFWFKIFIWA